MLVLCAVLEKLLRGQRRILDNQTTIIERIESMSQVLDQIKDFAAKIDEATNVIAARIQALIDKVNSGTATPEEIAAVLQPEVDRLTEMGKDAANPA
jgi:methyl-accepting chemotaxis protein